MPLVLIPETSETQQHLFLSVSKVNTMRRKSQDLLVSKSIYRTHNERERIQVFTPPERGREGFSCPCQFQKAPTTGKLVSAFVDLWLCIKGWRGWHIESVFLILFSLSRTSKCYAPSSASSPKEFPLFEHNAVSFCAPSPKRLGSRTVLLKSHLAVLERWRHGT